MNEPIETIKENRPAPSDFLRVSYRVPGDDAFVEHEIFMSAGLIRQLVALSQLGSDTSELYSNPKIQEILMLEALAPRNKRGQPTVEATLDDFEMAIAEGEKLISWIREHVIYFFTNAVLNLKTASEDPKSSLMNLSKLMQSLSGSVDSAEKSV